MKRVIALIILSLILISFVGCGIIGLSSGKKAVIKDNTGNTVEITYSDLYKEFTSNDNAFKNKYDGASITITGEVKKVENNNIRLKDGWIIFIPYISDGENQVYLNTLTSGDKIKVTSKIQQRGQIEFILADYETLSSGLYKADYTVIEKLN